MGGLRPSKNPYINTTTELSRVEEIIYGKDLKQTLQELAIFRYTLLLKVADSLRPGIFL